MDGFLTRRFLARFLVCAALGAAAPVAAASDTIRGVPFPLELADFRRGPVIDNEPNHPGLGVSIPYSGPGVVATVFVYDLGLSNIPSGVVSREVRAQAAQAEREIFSARPNVEVLQPLSAGEASCQRFLRAKYRFPEHSSVANQWVHSYLYVGSAKGNFVKIRLSYREGAGLLFRADAANRFAAAICTLTSQ